MEQLSKILVVVLIALALVCLFAFPTMWLWNWLMPDIFDLKEINFNKALGINLLTYILFKGGGSSR